MPRTIVLDGLEVAQVILMRDKASGKVLVRATYQVKAGDEVVKTTPDRILTLPPAPAQARQPADLMGAQEQAAATAIWNAVEAALRRLELG